MHSGLLSSVPLPWVLCVWSDWRSQTSARGAGDTFDETMREDGRIGGWMVKAQAVAWCIAMRSLVHKVEVVFIQLEDWLLLVVPVCDWCLVRSEWVAPYMCVSFMVFQLLQANYIYTSRSAFDCIATQRPNRQQTDVISKRIVYVRRMTDTHKYRHTLSLSLHMLRKNDELRDRCECIWRWEVTDGAHWAIKRRTQAVKCSVVGLDFEWEEETESCVFMQQSIWGNRFLRVFELKLNNRDRTMFCGICAEFDRIYNFSDVWRFKYVLSMHESKNVFWDTTIWYI